MSLAGLQSDLFRLHEQQALQLTHLERRMASFERALQGAAIASLPEPTPSKRDTVTVPEATIRRSQRTWPIVLALLMWVASLLASHLYWQRHVPTQEHISLMWDGMKYRQEVEK